MPVEMICVTDDVFRFARMQCDGGAFWALGQDSTISRIAGSSTFCPRFRWTIVKYSKSAKMAGIP